MNLLGIIKDTSLALGTALLIFSLFFGQGLSLPASVYAAANVTAINSVTLDGGPSVTVSPGSNITVAVNTSISGSDKWRCTVSQIEGQSATAHDHSNHDTDGTYNEAFSIAAPSNEGTYDFTVRAHKNDSCNNEGDSETLTNAIVVDVPDTTEPSTIWDSAFSPTYYTNDQTPTLTGTSTDDDSGIAEVEYRIVDNSDSSVVEGWLSATPADGAFNNELSEDFSVTPSSALDEGTYTFYARATDQAGNTESTATTIIVVDATQPSTSVTTTSADPTNISPIPVTVTFSEDVTGFDPTDVVIGNGDLSNFSGSGSVYTFDITPAAEGAVTVDIASGAAQDAAANDNLTATQLSVIYDNTPPDEPVASPGAGDYASDQLVALTSSDATSGLVIYFTTDGTTPDNTSTLYTAPIAVGQDTTIKAIAYDNVGNASSVLSAAFGIAPVISLEASSLITTTSVTISWVTDDPATSRVIYDTVPHNPIAASGPNYGYASSTTEDPALVLNHVVTISGLTPGTTYYFRTVSHGSPEAVSNEHSFKTDSNGDSEGGTGETGGTGSNGTPQNSGQPTNNGPALTGSTLAAAITQLVTTGAPGDTDEATGTKQDDTNPTDQGTDDEGEVAAATTTDNDSWWWLLAPTILLILFLLWRRRREDEAA